MSEGTLGAGSGDNNLRGLWWDQQKRLLRCKAKGVGAFCFQLDLLTTKTRRGMSDQLERDFEQIDTPGIVARDRISNGGPHSLSLEGRCHFARLLMSLECRRPSNVAKIRTAALTAGKLLDSDPEVLQAFQQEGIEIRPSTWYAQEALDGPLSESSFVELMRAVVDHAPTGKKLINGRWARIDFDSRHGTLVLSDRPLLAVGSIVSNEEKWIWATPLSPTSLFVAASDPKTMSSLAQHSRRQLLKMVNRTSVWNAERFVFVADGSHNHWVAKYLSCKST